MSSPDFSRRIPFFLQAFLSKPASALPKGGQWVVDFGDFLSVKKAILNTAKLEPNKGWNIQAGFNTITQGDYINKGCLFVQAIQLPGESVIANPEGIQKNHFIRTATGDGRGDYAPNGIRMVFLNTNVSFVDNVIRPWVVTTSRLGLIARPNDETQYRQDITVYKLGVTEPSVPPYVTEKYIFNGVCPIEVSSEEYNYTPLTSPINREATFLFHTYRVETFTPAATLLNTKLQNVKGSQTTAQNELAKALNLPATTSKQRLERQSAITKAQEKINKINKEAVQINQQLKNALSQQRTN